MAKALVINMDHGIRIPITKIIDFFAFLLPETSYLLSGPLSDFLACEFYFQLALPQFLWISNFFCI